MKRRLLLCGLLLILMAMVSMMTGTRFYSLAQVTNALFHADTTSTVDTIIRTSLSQDTAMRSNRWLALWPYCRSTWSKSLNAYFGLHDVYGVAGDRLSARL
jgi:hypothetical protein